MDVCEVCGGVAFTDLLVRCNKCKDSARHPGIMKFDQEYISLAAHLSNQACKEVLELSLSLPPLMKVTMISRWEALETLETLELTAESIGLYFFSDMMRTNKELDILVQHVTDHRMVLKYAVGFAELLIFPSILLPEQCQIFQGKHYLWGVFKRRMCGTSGKQKDCPSHIAQEKKQQHDKVQGETQDPEEPVLKHIMQSNSQPSPNTGLEIGAETETQTDPVGDRGEPCSNSETPSPKLFGLVVAQTPRSEQFIRELQNEGAVVFSVVQLTKSGHMGV